MRKPQSARWWATEADYVAGIDPARPGPDFHNSPATFARYCDMQARFAAIDGADSAAEIIRAQGSAALVASVNIKKDFAR